MSRFWKVILSLTVPLVFITVSIVLFFGPDYLYQNYRTGKMVSAAHDSATVELDLGLIKWQGTPSNNPIESVVIQRLSSELQKHGNTAHISLKWQLTANTDSWIDYYPSVQALIYCPRLGGEYRYEGVKPEHLHKLATDHAQHFDILKQFGCSVTDYDND